MCILSSFFFRFLLLYLHIIYENILLTSSDYTFWKCLKGWVNNFFITPQKNYRERFFQDVYWYTNNTKRSPQIKETYSARTHSQMNIMKNRYKWGNIYGLSTRRYRVEVIVPNWIILFFLRSYCHGKVSINKYFRVIPRRKRRLSIYNLFIHGLRFFSRKSTIVET